MRHVVYDVTEMAVWIGWGAVGIVWVVCAVLGIGRIGRGARGAGRIGRGVRGAGRIGRALQGRWADAGVAVRGRSGHDLPSRLGGMLAMIVVATPGALWRQLTLGWPAVRLAGFVLFALATAATIWARIALGTMWSSTPVARENHGLRTTGPYAITRHPIYTGVLAMLAGTAVMQGSGRWVALFALVLGVLLLKIRSEERLLEHELGAAYTRYRRRVPRLLPDPRRSRRR